MPNPRAVAAVVCNLGAAAEPRGTTANGQRDRDMRTVLRSPSSARRSPHGVKIS